MASNLGSMKIHSIHIFCKAAEAGNFTAAAEQLGVAPATVSRSIARLENRLGVQLFARTTRQIRLTENGRVYFERCRDAIEQIDEVERELSGSRGVLGGTIRISVPTTYGHFRLLPLLSHFRRQYPRVVLDVNISNQNIDFVDDGYDLAIRLGTPRDSSLVARRLENADLGVYASRGYLDERGTLESLEDLSLHDCIQFVLPSTGRPMPWIFRDDGRDIDIPLNSPVRFSGDVLGCVGYAHAGGGLYQTYDFIARCSQYPELVEVLPAYRGRFRPFFILYPHHRHLSTKVRVFVDFLISEAGLDLP